MIGTNGKSLWITFSAIVFALFFFNTSALYAQETPLIAYGDEVEGELTPENPVSEFRFNASAGHVVAITLLFEERDFSVTMSLINPQSNTITSNDGVNYPIFQGAFIFAGLSLQGTHKIRIESPDLVASAPFTLRLERRIADEDANQNYPTLEKDQPAYGIIAPDDQDAYVFDLVRGQTVVFVCDAPDGILAHFMVLIDPGGNQDYIGDFLGGPPVYYFIAPRDGEYALILVGYTAEDTGPYMLTYHDVLFPNPGEPIDDSIQTPGDAFVYEMSLDEAHAYDFQAQGNDGFETLLILTDQDMEPVALNGADETANTSIPGFTPVENEQFLLFAFGQDPKATGTYSYEYSIHQDEADGRPLPFGEELQTTIGPVGDVDTFHISVEAGKHYSIYAATDWHNLDPEIVILDLNGQEIFRNDDSAIGYDAFLSNIQFPETGTYVVRVQASSYQETEQYLTGVVAVAIEEGASFDGVPPLFYESLMSVTPTVTGNIITIPPEAVAEDTFPVSATLFFDREDREMPFTIQAGQTVTLDLESQEDEIFFIYGADSSDAHNGILSTAIPAPEALAQLQSGPAGITVDEEGSLYIADSYYGAVVKLPGDGTYEFILTDQDTAGGSMGPNAVAFDGDGNLYLSNAKTNSIVRLTPDGELETFVTGLSYPVAIAFDRDGNLYVAQIGSDRVDKVLPDGTIEPFVTTIRNPTCLAFGPDNRLYVGNDDSGQSSVFQILEDGTPEPYVASFTESVESIVFDMDGNLYAADGTLGFMLRISPEKGILPFTAGLSGPVSLAYGRGDRAKSIFAVNMGNYSGRLYQYLLISIPTGREGIELPFTDINGWMLY